MTWKNKVLKHALIPVLWFLAVATFCLMAESLINVATDPERTLFHSCFFIYWWVCEYRIVACLVDHYRSRIKIRRLKKELEMFRTAVQQERIIAAAHHCDQVDAYLAEMEKENDRLQRDLNQWG